MHDGWRAFIIERRNQRLAHFELGDHSFDIEVRINPEGFGRSPDRLLIARGEGAQRVLDPVAQLPGDLFGNVDRILGNEIDAHPLRPDQPHHLLDLVEQRLGRVIKQQVRLVKEEHQAGLFGIAHFGQRLEQFGQQVEQESRIELGALHQLVSGQDVDHPLAALVDADEIVDLERRLAKKLGGTLAFEGQQLPLDRANRGFGDIAIGGCQFAGMLGAGDQRLLQVIEIEQQQAVVISPFEGNR